MLRPAVLLLVLVAAGSASAQALTLCKAAIDALKIDVTGSTVFCPSNRGFEAFARMLRFTNAQAMLAGVPADTLRQVLSLHILPGAIRTTATLPRRSVAPTLLGGGRDGSVTIVKPRRNSIEDMELRYRTIDATDDPSDPRRVQVEDSDVSVADSTLSGTPYRGGGVDTHVVHVLDDVMVPVAAGPALRAVRWNNIGVQGRRKQ